MKELLKYIDFVYKPIKENDSLIFKIKANNLIEFQNIFKEIENNLDNIQKEYFNIKNKLFENIDINKSEILKFKLTNNINFPSIKDIDKLDNLPKTIYTNSILLENNYEYNYVNKKRVLDRIYSTISEIIKLSPRRAYLRLVNDINRYFKSLYEPTDISCCIGIHFLENRCILNFRASDVKYDLIVDLLTIFYNIIYPIYFRCEKSNLNEILFIANTAQNIEGI